MPLTVKRTLPCLYHYVDPSLNLSPNPNPIPTPTDPVTKSSDLTDSIVIQSARDSTAAESKSTEAVDLTNPTAALLTILSPIKATTASSSSSAPITAQGQGQGQVQVGSTTKRKRITPTVVGVLGSNTHLLTGNMLTASPSDTSKNSSSNNNNSSSSGSSSGHDNGKDGKEGDEGEERKGGRDWSLSGSMCAHHTQAAVFNSAARDCRADLQSVWCCPVPAWPRARAARCRTRYSPANEGWPRRQCAPRPRCRGRSKRERLR